MLYYKNNINSSNNLKVLKASLVRTPKSIYMPLPNMERLRPSQETPVDNLFLAGGYTKGHSFFDSQEGAVCSGVLTAKSLIKKIYK